MEIFLFSRISIYILISLYGLTPQIAHIASVYRTPSLVCGHGAQPPHAQTDCKLDCAKVKESKPMRLSTTQVSP